MRYRCLLSHTAVLLLLVLVVLPSSSGASQSSWENPPPPQRPPPFPQSSDSSSPLPSTPQQPQQYRPIHYQFRGTNNNNDVASKDNNDDDYASARKDVIGRTISTTMGRLSLFGSCGMVGGSLGAFIGKSLWNNPYSLAIPLFVTFVIIGTLRNAYGELTKSLGMALLLAMRRSRQIRRDYPTWPHIKSSLAADQRRPFPPSKNIWNYQPRRGDNKNDPEFKMLYATICMAFVGSACGGNLPLIPHWMGALAGAGLFALACTLPSSRGDLCRTMGMRVVRMGQLSLQINQELSLLPKAGVVTGKVWDKVMILDRQHRVKDRIVAMASWVFDRATQTASNIQTDMNNKSSNNKNNDDDDPRNNDDVDDNEQNDYYDKRRRRPRNEQDDHRRRR